MDKILGIVSLFSVIWSNALIYILVFIYNIFSVRYCSKVQKEKQSSKIPKMIAIAGITLYICITMIITFLVSIVEISGGA